MARRSNHFITLCSHRWPSQKLAEMQSNPFVPTGLVEWEMLQPLWRTLWEFLHAPSYDPAIPFSRTFTREIKARVHTKAYNIQQFYW